MALPWGKNAKPRWNASIVMFTPSRPSFGSHAPVMTIESPVIVQMMIVSKNVPVMQTSPCRTGSLVFAAAAAIGAEPRPASFEKMPRAMPFCIAMKTDPTTPPVTADGLNAARTIVSMASEMCEKLRSRKNPQTRT